MSYVLRNIAGKIQAVSLTAMEGQGWEFVEADSREYQDFLEGAISEQSPFRESDIQLARVLEDLVNLLIDRDVIRFTDLPAPAQKRLVERQTLRMKSKQLDLIDETTSLF